MSRRGPRTPAAPHNYDAYASDVDLSGSLTTERPMLDSLDARFANESRGFAPETPSGLSMLDDLEGNSPIRPPPMMRSQALDQIAIHNRMNASRGFTKAVSTPSIEPGGLDIGAVDKTPSSEAPTIKAQTGDENEMETRKNSMRADWAKGALSEAWTTPREEFTKDYSRETESSSRPVASDATVNTLPSLPSQESSLSPQQFEELIVAPEQSIMDDADEAPDDRSRQHTTEADPEPDEATFASGTFVINGNENNGDSTPWRRYGNGGNMRDIFQEPIEDPQIIATADDLDTGDEVNLPDGIRDISLLDFHNGRSSEIRQGETVELTDLPDVSLVYSHREDQQGSAAERSSGRSEVSNIGDTWLHSGPNSVTSAQKTGPRDSRSPSNGVNDPQNLSSRAESLADYSTHPAETTRSDTKSEEEITEPPPLPRSQRTFTTAQVTWRKGARFPVSISVVPEPSSEAEDEAERAQQHQMRGRLMLERMQEGLQLSSHDEADPVDRPSSEQSVRSRDDEIMNLQQDTGFESPPESVKKLSTQPLADLRQTGSGPSFSATFRSDPLDTLADRNSLRSQNVGAGQIPLLEQQVRSVSDPARNRVQTAREFMKGLREKMLALDKVQEGSLPTLPAITSREEASETRLPHDLGDGNLTADSVREHPSVAMRLRQASNSAGAVNQQMRTIRPDSIAPPRQIGQMVFDENLKKWYKAPVPVESREQTKPKSGLAPSADASESSVDAFDDLESDVRSSSGSSRHGRVREEKPDNSDLVLRPTADEGSPAMSIHPDSSVSQRKAQNPAETAKASGVDHSPSQYRAEPGIPVLTRRPLGDLPIVTTGQQLPRQHVDKQLAISGAIKKTDSILKASRPALPTLSDPDPQVVARPISTPSPSNGWPRPAIRLEQNESQLQVPRSRSDTPRSVSFSDGRKTGRKIKGLEHMQRGSLLFQEVSRPASTITDDPDSLQATLERQDVKVADEGKIPENMVSRQSSSAMSNRTRRLADAVSSLESLQLGPIPPTPSHISNGAYSPDMSASEDDEQATEVPRETAARRRLSVITMADLNQTPAKWGFRGGPDPSHTQQTMLTNWDFSVAQDRLVESITRVEPYEPYWEHLTTLNLSRQGLESLIRLKEFLPRLEEVDLSENRLEYLSGLPKSISKLIVRNNNLNGISSFEHMPNLRYLDVAHNQCDSLIGIGNLPHLQHLCADHNQISDLDAVLDLNALSRLSVRYNTIETVHFENSNLYSLEILNLSSNSITEVHAIEKLVSLIFLDLDGNKLTHFCPEQPMRSMKTLRLNSNALKSFNFEHMPNLRRFYADENILENFQGHEQLSHLEQLSLRDQRSSLFRLKLDSFPDLQKLWLSGNAYQTSWLLSSRLLNLLLLEINHCTITDLPTEFNLIAPNLRVLHARSNFIADIRSLANIERLYKLDLVGNQLKGVADINRVLEQLPSLQELDLRSNPVTLSLYPPLVAALPKKSSRALIYPGSEEISHCGTEHLELEIAWLRLDEKHCRGLNDRWAQRRMYYRGMCLEACPHLASLDGIKVVAEEEAQARAYLDQMIQQHLSKQRHAQQRSQPGALRQKLRPT